MIQIKETGITKENILHKLLSCIKSHIFYSLILNCIPFLSRKSIIIGNNFRNVFPTPLPICVNTSNRIKVRAEKVKYLK